MTQCGAISNEIFKYSNQTHLQRSRFEKILISDIVSEPHSYGSKVTQNFHPLILFYGQESESNHNEEKLFFAHARCL